MNALISRLNTSRKVYPDLNLSTNELKNLFHFATSRTHFLFKGSFYDQIDGVAMGSPLAPVLANLFMGHHEKFGWKPTGPPKLYFTCVTLMTRFLALIHRTFKINNKWSGPGCSKDD